jgi:hypothetical protein
MTQSIFCLRKDLLKWLEDNGADKDEDGNFLITGPSPPVIGIGGDEVILAVSTLYRKNGEWKPLVKNIEDNFSWSIINVI